MTLPRIGSCKTRLELYDLKAGKVTTSSKSCRRITTTMVCSVLRRQQDPPCDELPRRKTRTIILLCDASTWPRELCKRRRRSKGLPTGRRCTRIASGR